MTNLRVFGYTERVTENFSIPHAFAQKLTAWYKGNARALPWRENKDPYRVWVSEIMLQQTRVNQAVAYYDRFMRRFPDVESLASADEDELLKYWEGLGYYSRAKNLHKTAKIIAAQYNGIFPRDYASVRRLPGVGDYTAGTICAICFNLPTPSVDGNILRVIARICASGADIGEEKTKRLVYDALAPLYKVWLASSGDCGDLTQALMELGATVCIPNGAPKCESCPVNDLCEAHRQNLTSALPVKSAKKKPTATELTVFVVRCGTDFAVQKRPANGLLAGLWEFPNIAGKLDEPEAKAAVQALGFINFAPDAIKNATHVFTHRVWDMRVYYGTTDEKTGGFIWINPAEIALPTAFKKLI